MSDRATLHRLSTMVTTRYVALLGDDDFLVTTGVRACADFLDAHPDFIGANGLAWAFTIEPRSPGESEVYGEMNVFDRYPQPQFLQAGAVGRYQAYLADYQATLFTLHRAEAWREMWRDVRMLEDRTFGAELLPSILSPVLGRIKHLDCMYLLRQSHGRRYLLPGGDDWMKGPDWQTQYGKFRELLLQRLRSLDARPESELRAIIEEAFESGYLSRFRRASAPAPAGPAPRLEGPLGRLARRITGMLSARSPATPVAVANPLQDWLRPGSAHYEAFQPVHRIISGVRDSGAG